MAGLDSSTPAANAATMQVDTPWSRSCAAFVAFTRGADMQPAQLRELAAALIAEADELDWPRLEAIHG